MIVKIHKRCIKYYPKTLENYNIKVDNLHKDPDFIIKNDSDWEKLFKIIKCDQEYPDREKVEQVIKMVESSDENTAKLGISLLLKNLNYKEIELVKNNWLFTKQFDSINFIEHMLWTVHRLDSETNENIN